MPSIISATGCRRSSVPAAPASTAPTSRRSASTELTGPRRSGPTPAGPMPIPLCPTLPSPAGSCAASSSALACASTQGSLSTYTTPVSPAIRCAISCVLPPAGSPDPTSRNCLILAGPARNRVARTRNARSVRAVSGRCGNSAAIACPATRSALNQSRPPSQKILTRAGCATPTSTPGGTSPPGTSSSSLIPRILPDPTPPRRANGANGLANPRSNPPAAGLLAPLAPWWAGELRRTPSGIGRKGGIGIGRGEKRPKEAGAAERAAVCLVAVAAPLRPVEIAGVEDRRAGRGRQHRDVGDIQVAADVPDGDRRDLVRFDEPQLVRPQCLQVPGGRRMASAQLMLDLPVSPAAGADPHHEALEDVFLFDRQHMLKEPELLPVLGQHRNPERNPGISNSKLVIPVHTPTLPHEGEHALHEQRAHPGGRGPDDRVGPGQRQADVPGAAWPVQFARRDEDAGRRQQFGRRPAVMPRMRRPQIQASF